jgi:hypothetical protein
VVDPPKVEVITGGMTKRNPAKTARPATQKQLTAAQMRLDHETQLKAFAIADANNDGTLNTKERKVFRQLVGRKKQSKAR